MPLSKLKSHSISRQKSENHSWLHPPRVYIYINNQGSLVGCWPLMFTRSQSIYRCGATSCIYTPATAPRPYASYVCARRCSVRDLIGNRSPPSKASNRGSRFSRLASHHLRGSSFFWQLPNTEHSRKSVWLIAIVRITTPFSTLAVLLLNSYTSSLPRIEYFVNKFERVLCGKSIFFFLNQSITSLFINVYRRGNVRREGAEVRNEKRY